MSIDTHQNSTKLISNKNCALMGRGGRGVKKKAPDEKYIRQNISMEPEQLKRLEEFCQREERSMSWVIRQALAVYLQQGQS